MTNELSMYGGIDIDAMSKNRRNSKNSKKFKKISRTHTHTTRTLGPFFHTLFFELFFENFEIQIILMRF